VPVPVAHLLRSAKRAVPEAGAPGRKLFTMDEPARLTPQPNAWWRGRLAREFLLLRARTLAPTGETPVPLSRHFDSAFAMVFEQLGVRIDHQFDQIGKFRLGRPTQLAPGFAGVSN
jgi:hypothetical protein